MGAVDLAWHVLNFFAPAVLVGCTTAVLAKLLWWRALRGVPWLRLQGVAVLACAAALVAGLWFFGRDGKMATYGWMVLACAAGVWWAGFLRRPG